MSLSPSLPLGACGDNNPTSPSSLPEKNAANHNNASVPPRDCFLMVENPSKSTNWGPSLRCAAAFGVRQVVLVGYRQCSTEGSHGAARHVSTVAFPTWEQAVPYVKSSQDCRMIGILGGVGTLQTVLPVAIQPHKNLKGDSFPVVVATHSSDCHASCQVEHHDDENDKDDENDTEARQSSWKNDHAGDKSDKEKEKKRGDKSDLPPILPPHLDVSTCITEPTLFSNRPESPNVCFVVSKTSPGLPLHQARHCDAFVHISVVEKGLLDTAAELSIVLHHFCKSAPPAIRVGQKYQVASWSKGEISKEQQRIEQEKRQRQRQARSVQQEESLECMENMFGLEQDEEQEEEIDETRW